jgi:hypothetical protein
MPPCFQHPNKAAEVIFTFYDRGQLVEVCMCHICHHAAAIAALVYEDIIKEPYEIIDVEE